MFSPHFSMGFQQFLSNQWDIILSLFCGRRELPRCESWLPVRANSLSIRRLAWDPVPGIHRVAMGLVHWHVRTNPFHHFIPFPPKKANDITPGHQLWPRFQTHLLWKPGIPRPEGMVASAIEFGEVCRKHDFHNFIFSRLDWRDLGTFQMWRRENPWFFHVFSIYISLIYLYIYHIDSINTQNIPTTHYIIICYNIYFHIYKEHRSILLVDSCFFLVAMLYLECGYVATSRTRKFTNQAKGILVSRWHFLRSTGDITRWAWNRLMWMVRI